MKLIDLNGYQADTYSREAGQGHPLVGLDGLEAALAGHNTPVGVEVGNTTKISDLEPYLDRVTLIAIGFPAFSDGRGFSIAKRLRNAGFKGTLRAVGPLISDQFAYALACGFNEIELPETSADRQPAEQWQKAATHFSGPFQRGYATGQSILDQRRAARKASGNV